MIKYKVGRPKNFKLSKESKDKIKKANTGKNNGMYKKIESIAIDSNGYQLIKIAEHKWVKYHRYLVEKYIGYKLKKGWIIHHIDKNTSNNKLTNLYIFKSLKYHMYFEILTKFKEINKFILKSNLKNYRRKK
jgi:hypothetical protein